MKKLTTLLLCLAIVFCSSCSPEDSKREIIVQDAYSDLIGSWKLVGLGGDGPNTQNNVPLYFSVVPGLNYCLFESVLTFEQGRKSSYSHRIELNERCLSNPIPFRNMKWSEDGNLRMALDYDYNDNHYHHKVGYNITGGNMLSIEIDGEMKSYWEKEQN